LVEIERTIQACLQGAGRLVPAVPLGITKVSSPIGNKSFGSRLSAAFSNDKFVLPQMASSFEDIFIWIYMGTLALGAPVFWIIFEVYDRLKARAMRKQVDTADMANHKGTGVKDNHDASSPIENKRMSNASRVEGLLSQDRVFTRRTLFKLSFLTVAGVAVSTVAANRIYNYLKTPQSLEEQLQKATQEVSAYLDEVAKISGLTNEEKEELRGRIIEFTNNMLHPVSKKHEPGIMPATRAPQPSIPAFSQDYLEELSVLGRDRIEIGSAILRFCIHVLPRDFASIVRKNELFSKIPNTAAQLLALTKEGEESRRNFKEYIGLSIGFKVRGYRIEMAYREARGITRLGRYLSRLSKIAASLPFKMDYDVLLPAIDKGRKFNIDKLRI